MALFKPTYDLGALHYSLKSIRGIYLDHPCTAKHRPWEQPIRGGKYSWQGLCYPLVMTNIAIEHGPFIVDLPIKDGDFP